MSIDSTWFRCPNCSRELSSLSELVIGCASGHRFDVSRQGTVTLLAPNAPRSIGDDRAMLEARRQLLGSGVYRPISDALLTSAEEAGIGGEAVHSSLTPRIADLGCGTGYYSEALAHSYPSASFLAADRSPAAVRIATRSIPRASGVILDLWRPLPIRDDAVDLAINVFAPRHPAEFARVVRPAGVVIVVVPTAGHLAELRSAASMLDIPSGKDELVTSRFAAVGLAAECALHVEYRQDIDAARRAELVAMGPSAHHPTSGPGENSKTPAPGDQPVTISVDVLTFRRSAID